MISPVVSPLPSQDPFNLYLNGENDEEFDDRPRVTQAEISKLLEKQIREQAEKTARENGKNKQFERLYQLALHPSMKKKLKPFSFVKIYQKVKKSIVLHLYFEWHKKIQILNILEKLLFPLSFKYSYLSKTLLNSVYFSGI